MDRTNAGAERPESLQAETMDTLCELQKRMVGVNNGIEEIHIRLYGPKARAETPKIAEDKGRPEPPPHLSGTLRKQHDFLRDQLCMAEESLAAIIRRL